MNPAIIITQTMVAAAARRWSLVRLASSTRSDVPAAPTPAPIRQNATTASAMPNSGCVVIHAVATDAKQTAGRENRHAANDPRGSPRTEVGAVSPRWPEYLQRIMNSYQRAGQHRGHRKLDHHHPVQRRGGKDDDRAEAGLHRPSRKIPNHERTGLFMVTLPYRRQRERADQHPDHIAADPGAFYQGARSRGS